MTRAFTPLTLISAACGVAIQSSSTASLCCAAGSRVYRVYLLQLCVPLFLSFSLSFYNAHIHILAVHNIITLYRRFVGRDARGREADDRAERKKKKRYTAALRCRRNENKIAKKTPNVH